MDKKLTFKQKKFCELYATNREFFGNGVQSYAEAFNIDLQKPGKYNYARAAASRLLTNDNILSYINELLDVVLNDAHIDKQMAFLITQNADFGSKLGAIKEYNNLKQRIKNKLEVTVKARQFTIAELREIVADNDRLDAEIKNITMGIAE